MEAIVKKGYVTFWKNRTFVGGETISSPIVEDVLKDQHWKIEVVKSKKEKKEKEEEQELKEIIENKMMENNEVKKK